MTAGEKYAHKRIMRGDATSESLGKVIAWNVKEDRLEWSRPVREAVISAAAFAPDGSLLVAAGRQIDGHPAAD